MSVPITGHSTIAGTMPGTNVRNTAKAWGTLPMVANYWGIPGHGLTQPN